MRIALVVALVACGKSERSASEQKQAAIDDEEKCDPKETRVCVGTRVVACEDGKLGRALRQCRDECRKGRCVGSCVDGAELIYVVDDRENLLSFDPRKLPDDPFRLIGRLNCGGRGSPFSMSVDRNGTAWVVYGDGQLFEVSIADATCKRSGFAAGRTFGMGFVSDEPGVKTEKLYVSANDGSRALGFIDTSGQTPVHQHVATIEAAQGAHPELTGTSEAKLYGFYPVESGVSFVQEIDRKTGAAVGTKWELGDRLDFVNAYAFAHWGGVFYIFVSTGVSTVRAIDKRTGAYKMVLDNIPYRITGAGVSTCAPERDAAGATDTP